MTGKTKTRSHLENLVASLVARYPLPKKPQRLGSTDGSAEGRKIPCLIWDMGKSGNGYGKIYVNGLQHQAHRWAYQFTFKTQLGRSNVCHSCDNPSCINPHHLFAGTQKDNLSDMRAKGRERKVGPKGNRNPKSIYSPNQVLEMRDRFGFGETISALRKQFGGTYQSIHAIVHRHTWQHLTHNH